VRIGRRAALAGIVGLPALAEAQDTAATLRDLARRATIYLFPVYEMYRARWRATVDETNPHRQRLNRFRHMPTLADSTTRDVTTPNADTLYSSAWLDLSLEPLFLTVPPVGDLYYSYAFIDLFTDNFLVVSNRLKGKGLVTHMIVGPKWKGDAPGDVTLVRAPTASAWLLGRILVDGPGELERVRILQNRVLLESPDMRNERRILETGELMRFRTQPPPEPVADWPAPDPGLPFDLFDIGMRALGESPLPERDRPLFETLAPLKLKPGRRFDQRAFSEAERRAIRAGIEQGHDDIRAAAARGRTIDGWTYGERSVGNFGDDYLYRAATALTALGALTPSEAVYVSCAVDAERRPLSGTERYTLTFPADRLPPARAFWSISAYELTPEGQSFFADNPIARYSIGDHTPDLMRGPDGSLTIYIQRERPEGARAANWLPAPGGPMRLVLRAYQPDEAMVDGRYRVPAVRRNSSP
jgi:hypothetical protein